MRKKQIGFCCMLLLTVSLLTGCIETSETTFVKRDIEKDETEPIIYEALLYDNNGNNFLSFEGKEFTITPNKVKQWGYDTDGSWISYYETSSVMTIEIDGNYIESCGSTVLFKDKGLNMLEIPNKWETRSVVESDRYSVTKDNRTLDTYLGLKYWWYDQNSKGQHGEKIILIQSQDGYNIGAFISSDVTWEIAGKLPKTTKIMIDGLPLYIHRCNFTIIDVDLMKEKNLDESFYVRD